MGTPIRAQYASVAAAAGSGDNVIVSGSANHLVRLYGYLLTADDNSELIWKGLDGTGATVDYTGNLFFRSGSTVCSHDSDWGILETAEGESLVLNVSGSGAIGGYVAYHLKSV